MKLLLKKLVLASVMASVLAITGVSQAATTNPVPQAQAQVKPKQPISILFVLSAKSGRIKKMSDGEYHLILSHVDPKLLWFTDRPNRKTGMMNAHNFIISWSNEFATSQPNVAMVYDKIKTTTPMGVAQAEAIELSDPLYMGRDLVFDVTSLAGGKVIPGHYTGVHVFVDDSSLPVSTSTFIPFDNAG